MVLSEDEVAALPTEGIVPIAGQAGVDNVTVDVNSADHLAEGTITLDQTDIAITAAAGGTADGTAVLGFEDKRLLIYRKLP